MIATATVALLILLTVYYAYFLLRAESGLARLPNAEPPATPTSFVSVVVAARNEERTVAECLHSILGQHPSSRNLEIVFVDDHSTDRTLEIARHIARTESRIRVVELSAVNPSNAGGKPAAIAAGVAAAKGEIILTTDADCLVPSEWIARTLPYFVPGVSLVAGAVRIGTDRGLLSQFDRLELLGLMTMGAGLIGAHHPIICNGANLAYRKNAFQTVQGYGVNGSWCDDETIMHRIHDRKIGSIVFNPDPDAIVTTASVGSVAAFWKQRLRWSSKGGHYESTAILLELVLLYFYFLLFLAALVGGIFSPSILKWVLVSFAAKVVVDAWTLSAGARFLRQRYSALAFVIAEIFHVPYIVVTAAFGQFTSLTWKGRTVNA